MFVRWRVAQKLCSNACRQLALRRPRPYRRRVRVTRAVLYEWYVKERMTMFEIANRLGVNLSNVCSALQRENIPRRDRRAYKLFTLTKEELIRAYPKSSTEAIAVATGVSQATVQHWLRKYGIKKPSGKKIERECVACHESFFISPCEAARRNRFFCSKSCYLTLVKDKALGQRFYAAGLAKLFTYEVRQRADRTRRGKPVPARYKIRITKDELKVLYVKQKLSLAKIAEMFHVSNGAVNGALERAGIPHRPHPWNKGRTQVYNESTLERIRAARKNQRIPRFMTKPEQKFVDIIKRNNLLLKYTGDGALWIDRLNPDFVAINERRAVEVFGEYWHSARNPRLQECRTEEGRRKRLASAGWRLLVLWESELKDEPAVLSKVNAFLA